MVVKSRISIMIERILIARNEVVIMTTTKWRVKVEADSLGPLPFAIRESFMKYIYGVEEGRLSSPGEEDHAKLQGTVLAHPFHVEERGLVSSSGEESYSEDLEWLEKHAKTK